MKETFLNDLRPRADDDFFDSATKTIRVIREYFSVNYVDVHSVTESHLTSTRHYKPSGEYTIDGKLEGDTLKVDVNQGSTYSHTTYDISESIKRVNRKKYYAQSVEKMGFTFEVISDFADKFYCTDETDESSLITAEEIMQDKLLLHLEPKSFLGSDAKFTHLQILLFPIWRVEIDYNNHTYVNYVSDVAPSEILFLELSEECKQIKEEKRHKEQIKRNEDQLFKKLIRFSVISSLIHILGLGMAFQGQGYCGFLIAHLGKVFGTILNVLGGFGLISVIFTSVAHIVDKFKVKYALNIIAYTIICIDILLYVVSVFKCA